MTGVPRWRTAPGSVRRGILKASGLNGHQALQSTYEGGQSRRLSSCHPPAGSQRSAATTTLGILELNCERLWPHTSRNECLLSTLISVLCADIYQLISEYKSKKSFLISCCLVTGYSLFFQSEKTGAQVLMLFVKGWRWLRTTGLPRLALSLCGHNV